MKKLIGVILSCCAFFSSPASSGAQAIGANESKILQELKRSYPECSIELQGPVRWTQGEVPSDGWNVRVSGDSGRGEVYLHAESEDFDRQSYGAVKFRATFSARIANKRIKPGEPLRAESFRTERVVVSGGGYQSVRQDLAPSTLPLDRIESGATIVEGSPLLLSQMQRTPDIRRGDRVQIKLIGKGLVLSTSGLAEEPGLIHGRLKVMTSRSKRELVGEVMEDGSVEVAL